MKHIYFLLFVFAFPTFGADFDIPSGFPKAYEEVFRLEIKSAKASIAELEKGSPFRVYLENYVEFIEVFNADQESLFQKVSGNESVRLKQIESLDGDSPYNKFLRAEILTQWAILKLKFGKESKGAYNAIQAVKLLNANQKEHPDFLPTYKSLGSLHVVIGSIPDNYKWALKLLGLKGSVSQGLSELTKASKDKIWGNEAVYSSLFLKAFTARFSESDNNILLKYVNARPDDLNAHFLASSISLRTQKAEQSSKILDKRPVSSEYLYLPIFELHEGESALAKGNAKQAVASYLDFLKNTKGQAYIKDAHLKLYFAHVLQGESAKAQVYLGKIPVVGNGLSDFDKTAEKYYAIIKKAAPAKEIISTKLATEGGYYQLALKSIGSLNSASLSNEWIAEYHFLQGVLKHKTGSSAEALEQLAKAITVSEKLQWSSTSANSALYLGYVYQSRKQTNQAKTYFEKALSYKSHEQKNTIDTKARAALTTLS